MPTLYTFQLPCSNIFKLKSLFAKYIPQLLPISTLIEDGHKRL